MTTSTQRAGMTVNATDFKQGHFPLWPDKYSSASTTSWVGQLARERAAVLAIAQVRHQQNENVRMAKAKDIIPVLPEAAVRGALARRQQRELDQLHHRVAKVADEIFKKRTSLRAFDFEKDGFIGALNRQELRAALRGMDDKQRTAAMKSHRYRAAALEQPPELSGLPASQHALLAEEELRAKFPAEIVDIEDAEAAVEIVRETMRPARAAVEAELLAAGSTVAEPAAAPAPAPAWT